MKLFILLFSTILSHTLIFAEGPTLDSQKLKNKKINVKSQGGMTLKTETRQASFYKDVVVSMGNLHMQCQKLDIEYSETGNKLEPKILKGEGQVFCEEKDKGIKAWCDSLVYDHSTEIMIVKSVGKKTRVIQGQQDFEAEGFKIFLKTGEMEVVGESEFNINLDD